MPGRNQSRSQDEESEGKDFPRSLFFILVEVSEMSCGDRIRTCDFQVMNLASYLCSTPPPMKESRCLGTHHALFNLKYTRAIRRNPGPVRVSTNRARLAPFDRGESHSTIDFPR